MFSSHSEKVSVRNFCAYECGSWVWSGQSRSPRLHLLLISSLRPVSCHFLAFHFFIMLLPEKPQLLKKVLYISVYSNYSMNFLKRDMLLIATWILTFYKSRKLTSALKTPCQIKCTYKFDIIFRLWQIQNWLCLANRLSILTLRWFPNFQYNTVPLYFIRYILWNLSFIIISKCYIVTQGNYLMT